MTRKTAATVERLAWRDKALGEVATPRGRLSLTLGVGSGLSRRAGDAAGTVWAIGDRGPNLKMALAIEEYGLDHLEALAGVEGAKLMPRPDIGPTICELRVDAGSVHLIRTLPLRDAYRRPISGLPIPGDGAEKIEPVFDVDGVSLGSDPSGADTEAIAAHSDGSFWIAEEYAPSLLKVDADGQVRMRWVPKGLARTLRDARYPVRAVLPKIATRRRLNRGFEALALSQDEQWLYAVFQSALEPRDAKAPRATAFARIWKLDAHTGDVAAQFVYPFDAPDSFARDVAAGTAKPGDLKLCEVQAIGSDRLLMLERISHTAKIYAVDLKDKLATPRAHLKSRTRPSIEDLDAIALGEHGVIPLAKRLVFTTDDAPEIDRDLEGMALLSPRELLLVNDNDFGVEGAATGFWRVRLPKDALGG